VSKSKKISGFRIDESIEKKEWFEDTPPDSIETIILYHGTSTLFLDAILKEGLKPRKETGISNWIPPFESHPDFVYLGTMEEVKTVGGKGYTEDMTNDKGHQVIIEIEVDTKNLYPDTDIMKEVDTWYESLIEVRTCAYKGSIKPERIRKIWKSTFPFEYDELIYDGTKEQKSSQLI